MSSSLLLYILVLADERPLYLGALLFIILVAHTQGKATLTNNGYDDFVVAISPDIQQDNSIIDNIKVCYKVLQNMTKQILSHTNNSIHEFSNGIIVFTQISHRKYSINTNSHRKHSIKTIFQLYFSMQSYFKSHVKFR